MLDLFQIMVKDNCGGAGPVVAIIKNGVFPIIYIGIPILLILFGTLDLGKAVMSNDDKAISKAAGTLVKRAIAALAVFLVSMAVSLIMRWLTSENGIAANTSWEGCWKNPIENTTEGDA